VKKVQPVEEYREKFPALAKTIVKIIFIFWIFFGTIL